MKDEHDFIEEAPNTISHTLNILNQKVRDGSIAHLHEDSQKIHHVQFPSPFKGTKQNIIIRKSKPWSLAGKKVGSKS